MLFRVEDVGLNNISDVLTVCKPPKMTEDYIKGVSIKREWLIEMIEKYGSVAKIGYFKHKPVAQLLYYPAIADPRYKNKGKNVLFINCVYNPFREAQRKGVARALFNSLLEEVKDKYNLIVTHAFVTGEYFSQKEFFLKMGFKPVPKGSPGDLYFPLKGEVPSIQVLSVWKESKGRYEPRSSDRGRAMIFYSPVCEFSYIFASYAARIVRELCSDIPVTLLNYWKESEEFLSRGEHWMIVNATPILSSPLEEKFKDEVLSSIKRDVK